MVRTTRSTRHAVTSEPVLSSPDLVDEAENTGGLVSDSDNGRDIGIADDNSGGDGAEITGVQSQTDLTVDAAVNSAETENAEPEPLAGAVFIPDTWGQSQVGPEPEVDTEDAASTQAQFHDPVEGMHYANSILAELLLKLPLPQMGRALRSALGQDAAARWLSQVEAAKAQRREWAQEIVRQAVMGSLGRRE